MDKLTMKASFHSTDGHSATLLSGMAEPAKLARGFTMEELAAAKSVDLTEVASRLGYTVLRIGNYHTIKEMNSIRIYNRTNWFRWSRQYDKGENGGSQIDFLRVFANMEIKEAVSWLLDFAGYRKMKDGQGQAPIVHPVKVEPEKKKPFTLPLPAPDNKYLTAYLHKNRAISLGIIQHFIDKDLIYESAQYHNIVFKGNDREGNTRFASMRGTSDKEGRIFKCDVKGSDKKYGFNTANPRSSQLKVYESGIDLMSYMDIFGEMETNKLALGMLSDAPLVTFLKENPYIRRICLCLDNDGPGQKATMELKLKYEQQGYEVLDNSPPKQYKDYNEWLVSSKIIGGTVKSVTVREKVR